MAKAKINKLDDFNDGFNDDFDEEDSFSSDWKPQDMSYDTFKLRNDPENILKKIKYYLMQVEETSDSDNPNIMVLKAKKNHVTNEKVTALVNQQGVEEIMLVLEPIINNHNVMGNMASSAEHMKLMLHISNDLTVYFWGKQSDWKLDINHVNSLIQFLSHEISIFLSRTIGDAERTHYGESFKETREVKPMSHEKKNFLSNFVPSGVFKR